jgi:hypothetical protein
MNEGAKSAGSNRQTKQPFYLKVLPHRWKGRDQRLIQPNDKEIYPKPTWFEGWFFSLNAKSALQISRLRQGLRRVSITSAAHQRTTNQSHQGGLSIKTK